MTALGAGTLADERRRLIGRKGDDKNLKSDMKHFPYKVELKGNKPIVEVMFKGEKKKFTPEEISAVILGDMKEVAQSYLGKKVTHAVVTVPAYFNVSLTCLPMCLLVANGPAGRPETGHQGRW